MNGNAGGSPMFRENPALGSGSHNPPEEVVEEKQIEKHDDVNHPSHYTQGKIESIEFIEDQGWGEGFCIGSALKYLTRYRHKGTPKKDLEKAIWYINRVIEMKYKDSK